MSVREQFQKLETHASGLIIGQAHLINRMLIALLCDGHLLVEGAPGLAKTRAIKVLSESIEGDFHRLQFTPDLLPADLTGTDIYRPQEGTFEFRKGPLFHNLILADEINRAPAKVQSALLEAMEERQISVGDKSYLLEDLFMVMATQNPIEQEGTYPLPEAQLDRFLLEIQVPYPDRATEREILLATTGTEVAALETVFDPGQLLAAQTLIRRMPVGDAVMELILDLVRAFRPDDASATAVVRENMRWGPGPRAAQALVLAVRAQALLRGSFSPSPTDVAELAPAVLNHRMALGFGARARGMTQLELIAEVTEVIVHQKAVA